MRHHGPFQPSKQSLAKFSQFNILAGGVRFAFRVAAMLANEVVQVQSLFN